MPQTVALRNFDFVSYTDKGLEREKNEDALAYFDTLNGHVFVVCDGMGGHAKGEVASEKAVEAVGEYFNEVYYKNPFLAVENAIIFANRKVYEYAQSNPELHNMGTTIVLVLVRDNRVFYGHVGDSRLYIFKKNNIRLLTRDHSYVNKLIEEKRITEKEAQNHPLKNEITRALGLFPDVEPEVSNAAFIPKEGDLLLLCSDGLNNMVDDKVIEKILSGKQNIEQKANTLIKEANDNGGIDNISVQLIRFHNVDTYHELPKRKALQIWLAKYLTMKTGIVLVLAIVLSFFGYQIVRKALSKKDEPELVTGNYQDKEKIVRIYAYMPDSSETFEDIAWKFNVDTDYLQILNPNINRENIGKHIKVPIQDVYVMQSSEDLTEICKRYNITLEKLMLANDFCSKNAPVGKELIIPLADE